LFDTANKGTIAARYVGSSVCFFVHHILIMKWLYPYLCSLFLEWRVQNLTRPFGPKVRHHHYHLTAGMIKLPFCEAKLVTNCCMTRGPVTEQWVFQRLITCLSHMMQYSSTLSLTLALDGSEWSASCPACFTPRKRAPVTHWIGGWVGPKAILDTVVKRKIPSPAGNWTLEPQSSSP
jgi:hypothetical protein